MDVLSVRPRFARSPSAAKGNYLTPLPSTPVQRYFLRVCRHDTWIQFSRYPLCPLAFSGPPFYLQHHHRLFYRSGKDAKTSIDRCICDGRARSSVELAFHSPAHHPPSEVPRVALSSDQNNKASRLSSRGHLSPPARFVRSHWRTFIPSVSLECPEDIHRQTIINTTPH